MFGLYASLIVRSSVRDLAFVVGQVIWLTHCVGSVARIMTRSMYAVVNQKLLWNSEVELTKEACDKLAFWDENVDSLNFHSPWAPLQPPAKPLSILTYPITPVVPSLIITTRFSIKIGVRQKVLKAQLGENLALSAFALELQGKKNSCLVC